MIGYLTGKVAVKKPTQIILDVNGVGYLVNISIVTFDKLGGVNDTVSLYTYLSVKEDALTLYGFSTIAEKEMFELLISISGIGPKLGQSILSGIETNELREAIKTGNISRITAVPGIGRKTAERLVVELRDKLDSLAESVDAAVESTSVKTDAVAALVSLGYNLKTSERIVRKLLDENSSLEIEELIKLSLSQLNK